MAKPIEHNIGSTIATVGYDAAKGTLAGFLLIPVVSAVITAAVVTGIAAIAGAGAAALGVTALVSGLVGLAGGGFLSATAAPFMAAGGGVLGFLKGGARVGAENAAYQNRIAQRTHARQHTLAARMNDAAMVGMQQGYMIGRQEGEQIGAQTVVAQLQQLQAQELERQAAASQPKAAGFTDKCGKCATHAETVTKQREVQNAAVNQIG